MKQKYTRHHIVPKNKGGGNEDTNVKRIAENRHEAYHLLFKNALPEEAILIILKEWWYKDPEIARDKLWQLAALIEGLIEIDLANEN